MRGKYLLTCLLTAWCRVLLEKLTGLQLVKKFPAFHGTPRFITALTSVRHLSLSCASPIQSIYPHPTSWRSVLILSTHQPLGLPSGGGNSIQNAHEQLVVCPNFTCKLRYSSSPAHKIVTDSNTRFEQLYLGNHSELDTCSYEPFC